jgi:hypothetical protein
LRTYIADLETTVYDGQTSTEAWASALVDIEAEDDISSVLIFHSLYETLEYLEHKDEDAVLYYHNLKFDGEFWLYFLIQVCGFKQGIEYISPTDVTMKQPKELDNNEVTYSISSMGQWYSITFKYHSHKYTLKDSLKLLPFSVKKIGKDFKTKHQKLTMEYEGKRYAGCQITKEEREYIANDVLVMKEALQIMFSEGHNKLTIGACCLHEFKNIVGRYEYTKLFPKLQEIELDPTIYGSDNADDYIRNSYHGGWCYLVKGAEGKTYYNGTTADVNSLYPSMMSSQSGNKYPYGKPVFWIGDIPEKVTKFNRYFFIRFTCRFYLKKGKLPFIQIKHNKRYRATEMLETSDIKDRKTGKYFSQFYDKDGNLQDTKVTLTMTCTDWVLFQEHYDIYDLEIHDGCWFFSMAGIFDEYINVYKQQKMTSKGAKRQIAKLFLNNLYGKLATSKLSSFKYAYSKEDTSLGFHVQLEENKEPVYIACGSAITSYSRNFTIRAAQANYHGADKAGFKYADTDSIHCDLPPSEIVGIRVDDNDFCAWKLESCWDYAKFIRQKTYVEHVTHEDLKPIEKPYYNIKCAGMPEHCKELFLKSIEGVTDEELKTYKPHTQEFLKQKRTIDDFKVGLKVPEKLLPQVIKGGVILQDVDYTLRPLPW